MIALMRRFSFAMDVAAKDRRGFAAWLERVVARYATRLASTLRAVFDVFELPLPEQLSNAPLRRAAVDIDAPHRQSAAAAATARPSLRLSSLSVAKRSAARRRLQQQQQHQHHSTIAASTSTSSSSGIIVPSSSSSSSSASSMSLSSSSSRATKRRLLPAARSASLPHLPHATVAAKQRKLSSKSRSILDLVAQENSAQQPKSSRAPHDR
jgi:hypothetical protein